MDKNIIKMGFYFSGWTPTEVEVHVYPTNVYLRVNEDVGISIKRKQLEVLLVAMEGLAPTMNSLVMAINQHANSLRNE